MCLLLNKFKLLLIIAIYAMILFPNYLQAQSDFADPNNPEYNYNNSITTFISSYNQGSRVVLLESNPSWCNGCNQPTNLPAGLLGTVVCTFSSNNIAGVLVSWDSWQGGNNNIDPCAELPLPFQSDSGWWVRDYQVTLYNESPREIQEISSLSTLAILILLNLILITGIFLSKRMVGWALPTSFTE